MDIRPLSLITVDQLFDAFSDAFSDYERTWSREEFDRLLRRRGYVPELSFGAFDGNRLAGFVINGIGDNDGKRTAYDAGTGTTKAYRGRGLTNRMLQESLPALRASGISQYVLEVLQHNEVAVEIYKKVEFTVSRALDYYVNKADEVTFRQAELPTEYSIRPMELRDLMQMQGTAFHDFHPTWQNTFDALSREPLHFMSAGVFSGEQLVGYGVIEPDTGDIAQLAVQKEHRRKGVGSAIFQALLRHNDSSSLKLINADSAYEPMAAFLCSHGLERKGRQYEMILQL